MLQIIIGGLMIKKDLRMVWLVPYNLSPIQQGIQSAHGIVELSRSENGLTSEKAKFNEWADDYKTIIINLSTFTISMTHIDVGLKILLLAITIGYTIQKWYLLNKNKKE